MFIRHLSLVWLLLVTGGAATAIGTDEARAEPTLSVARTDAGFLCQAGDRPVFEYKTEGVTYKPYVSKLWTPAGINVLRDSPHDHVHHHAMMFALEVDGADFWAEEPHPQIRPGSQLTRSASALADAGASAGIQSRLDWMNYQKESLVTEQRTVTARSLTGEATVLTWKSVLSVAGDKPSRKLGGHHYYGLGIRFVQSMDRDGRFLYSTGSAGDIIRGDERNTECQWCAVHRPGRRETGHGRHLRPSGQLPLDGRLYHGGRGPQFRLPCRDHKSVEGAEAAGDWPVASLLLGRGGVGRRIAPPAIEAAYRKWLQQTRSHGHQQDHNLGSLI